VQVQSRRIGNVMSAFHAGFPVASNILIFAMALPLLGHGAFRTGDFLAFIAAFASCVAGMLALSGALLTTLSVVPLYEQARPILQAEPEQSAGRSEPGALTGELEVQRLSFRYHAEGPLVLRDVSFQAKPGEFVAFVGPSGSGKSTILRLLLGFELPHAGAVYYDGQDLQGLDVSAVRRQIGVVLQSGRLMPGDILTNIIGSAPLTIEDAWEAARMAGLDEDVKAMPMGMHTLVNEGGSTLSGGQRQRLMIARAIVHRPRLLYFDEATSALDNRTQAIVSASLERLQATRIVIAHRLSTIHNADRIYAIQGGRIADGGTYTELMSRPGLFQDLARRQLL
jgi:ABC-type bacteriocin/lantibiotic exporter with double-glycine peptidase domain